MNVVAMNSGFNSLKHETYLNKFQKFTPYHTHYFSLYIIILCNVPVFCAMNNISENG
jgi:hypothetical protein